LSFPIQINLLTPSDMTLSALFLAEVVYTLFTKAGQRVPLRNAPDHWDEKPYFDISFCFELYDMLLGFEALFP
jgi:hypothetical protein